MKKPSRSTGGFSNVRLSLGGRGSEKRLLALAAAHESDSAEAQEGGQSWLWNWWYIAGGDTKGVLIAGIKPRRTTVGGAAVAGGGETGTVLSGWGIAIVFDVPAQANGRSNPIVGASSEVNTGEIELVDTAATDGCRHGGREKRSWSSGVVGVDFYGFRSDIIVKRNHRNPIESLCDRAGGESCGQQVGRQNIRVRVAACRGIGQTICTHVRQNYTSLRRAGSKERHGRKGQGQEFSLHRIQPLIETTKHTREARHPGTSPEVYRLHVRYVNHWISYCWLKKQENPKGMGVGECSVGENP